MKRVHSRARFIAVSGLAIVATSLLVGSASAARLGSFLYYAFDPPVIHNDATESTTLEVVTTGQDIREVQVQVLERQGQFITSVWKKMFNDGTHGDKKAGDATWTLDGITMPNTSCAWLGFQNTYSTRGFQVKIVKTSGVEETNWEPSLGVACKDYRYPAKPVGSGLYATQYAFFIVDPTGETLDAVIPLGYVKCGKAAFAAYHQLYSVFPDIFDFIIVMPSGAIFDPARDYGENTPYFVAAKNEVRNIGLPLFNNTAQFGSRGRLIGTIYHSFGSGAILDHEIAHAWGANIGRTLGLTDESAPPGNTARYHWNAYTDIGGQLGAFPNIGGRYADHLVPNPDGTFRVKDMQSDTEGTWTYSPLELYTMGLIPASEVPPVHKLVNPSFSDPNRITAERVETYTIQQIMQAEGGERIPSFRDSPKQFNVAFIAVKNKPFTQAEFDFFSHVSWFFASKLPGERYETPFYTGTGGRASLVADLGKLAPNLGIPVGMSIPTATPTPTASPTPPKVAPSPTPIPSPTPPKVTPSPTPIPSPILAPSPILITSPTPPPALPVPTLPAPSSPALPYPCGLFTGLLISIWVVWQLAVNARRS